MKLSDRIKQSQGEAQTETEFDDAPTRVVEDEGANRTPDDPLTRLKRRAQEALLVRMGPALFDSKTTPAQLDAIAVQELGSVIEEEKIPLTPSERDRLVAEITDQVLGYGPIERLLADPGVTEIMVNGLEGIYVERDGKIALTDAQFLSDDHILRVIDRIVAPVGRRVDELSPMVDARLADGSRVNAIIGPLALDGPVLTIRKFRQRRFTVGDLLGMGTMTQQLAAFLDACVVGRMNILVSGGTGSGKTTLLNVLSAMVPEEERIVTIEDSAELRLEQRHVVRLEGRPPNIEGRGEIVTRDLVRNALRMRPDRIIVGEVRGGEALDMLQAMNTGHDGSLSTLHANSPRDAISRIETMTLMAGFDLPIRAIREQIASAIDLLVHVARLRDGTRRITKVCGIEGMEGDVITLSDLFVFEYAEGREMDGRIKGTLRSTGLRPKFDDRLQDAGIEVPPDVFQPVAPGA
ncbi:MAG TPA: CpaF family protein [Acidimicrobiia bacterium]